MKDRTGLAREKSVRFGNTEIGSQYPVFIIAEAGVNHNGDIDMALRLVREAKRVGADCVKFQTFKAERVVTEEAPKAAYQLKTTSPGESQVDMLRKLELDESAHHRLLDACREEGIVFLSTPYNVEDVDFLDGLGAQAFKIASGQAVEPYFLEYVAKKGKPLLLSTGMCTLAEVDQAVRTIGGTGNKQILVLQCTTNYPSRIQDCNVRAMVTMGNAFDVLVGYSDHTRSLTAATVSVALGACVVERHFTLDKRLPGPDHSSSSDPQEFKEFVEQIRETELALGATLKCPSDVERKNAVGMRRSIVAKGKIPAGQVITEEMLTFKRPATGLTPALLLDLVGRVATCDIETDQMLSWEMIGAKYGNHDL
jgi:N-acetylneuraminate synthase/N,N'-diacetyllegionaminate synthase